MAQVINLAERAADRSRPSLGSAKFFFALECPLSYLAAERIERALGAIEWVPVISPFSVGAGAESPPVTEGDEYCVGDDPESIAYERLDLARSAAARLELPLVDPPGYPMDSRRAARVAVWAASHDAVHQYALAISRLVFCGGYDLNEDDVIAEAAASAGMDPVDALRAAGDPSHDLQIDATGRGLLKRGVAGAPAIRIGTSWFEGADPLLSLTAWSESHQPLA